MIQKQHVYHFDSVFRFQATQYNISSGGHNNDNVAETDRGYGRPIERGHSDLVKSPYRARITLSFTYESYWLIPTKKQCQRPLRVSSTHSALLFHLYRSEVTTEFFQPATSIQSHAGVFQTGQIILRTSSLRKPHVFSTDKTKHFVLLDFRPWQLLATWWRMWSRGKRIDQDAEFQYAGNGD